MVDELLSLKARDLNPIKLSLISFGSICGMGLGLLLSFVFISTFWRLLIAAVLLIIGVTSIIKNINLLR